MNSKFIRILAGILSAVMVLTCLGLSAFAAPVEVAENHDNANMLPKTKVLPIGDESYYKLSADGQSVELATAPRDDDGFEAIPSAYIGAGMGIYAAAGKVFFVKLADCEQDAEGNWFIQHGTADHATVSEEVDTADNEDPSMSTQFFINIDNGIGDIVKEDVVAAEGDAFVDYEITVETKTKYQLKATVPMFVCMYGYRGTGTVVTPLKDAYGIKNYSTIDMANKATIVDIVKITHLTKLYDEDHSNEEIYSIGYKEGADPAYIWFYSKPTQERVESEHFTAYIDLHEEGISANASGQLYVIYLDDAWMFKAAGLLDGTDLRETVAKVDEHHPLAADFEFGGFNFGKTPAVGDSKDHGDDVSSVEGLAIKVSELQAQPATWKVVPMSRSSENMKRGELAMSLAPEKALYNASAIDLAECSAPTEITERGWFLAAPAVTNGIVEEAGATRLGLITNAHIAGGNVNDAGCTPVLRVTYTIIPVLADNDTQTGTVAADSVNSNRG